MTPHTQLSNIHFNQFHPRRAPYHRHRSTQMKLYKPSQKPHPFNACRILNSITPTSTTYDAPQKTYLYDATTSPNNHYDAQPTTTPHPRVTYTAQGKKTPPPTTTTHKNHLQRHTKTLPPRQKTTAKTATKAPRYTYATYRLGTWPSRDPIEEDGGVNLYAFVNNQPTWYYDKLGLIVIAYYNKSASDPKKGTLTVFDVGDGKKKADGSYCVKKLLYKIPFYSGSEKGDPIPDGEYSILDHPDPDFYRLEPNDKNYGDDTHDATGRTVLRLHRPGGSSGCITCGQSEADRGDKTANDNWKKVNDFISETETKTAQVDNKSSNPFASDKEILKYYGTVIVTSPTK